MANPKKARVGMVKYVNMAPIYEVWKRTTQEEGWELVEAPPAALNRMLARGEIDMGFVSAYEYCARPENYRVLADLSISANGPVGSVFLFSRLPVRELSGRKVLLTSQSETSVCLVKIILEEFFQLRPEYSSGEIFDGDNIAHTAILAIGDEALRLVGDERFPHCLDLGEIWKQHTGLPFVFSLCAVREEFCASDPQLVGRIHREILRCRDAGKAELFSICELVAPRIPMSPQKCYDYLTAIEYDLADKKIQGVTKFFQYLIDRGVVGKQVLPLKILPLSEEISG
ncbi:MAG: menaquinone biosynthesis protein [Desulfocapsaceae bacterium]|nr:menaquinone biosynthesis protein [Desulfocapsaceae bacterium]